MKPRKIEGRIKKEENDFIWTYLGCFGEDQRVEAIKRRGGGITTGIYTEKPR